MEKLNIITETPMNEEKFPADIVFKAIIRNTGNFTLESIKTLLQAKNLKASVTTKDSGKGTFTSYTVAARFPSKECLTAVCNEISALQGFMTLF